MPELFDAGDDLKLLEEQLPDDLNPTLREIAMAVYLELIGDEELVTTIGKPRLAELAVAITDRVANDVGGATFYMPKGIGRKLSARDQLIGSRYNGRNKRELAREFSVSDMRIDQIYKKWRAAEVAKRQLKLYLD